jgi:hypothetical protein
MSLLLAFVIAGAVAAADSDSDYSPIEIRKVVDAYGKCIVAKQERRASEAIITNVNNRDLMREYPQLIDGGCLSAPVATVVQAKFAGDQFRYALADGLFRKELANAPVLNPAAIPPLYHPIPTPPSRLDKKGRPLSQRAYANAMKDYEEHAAFSFLSEYGECVVRANPAAARALLMAQPASPEESAQFAALQPVFATCLDEGHTVALGKLGLRGTIAVNYYRLAAAAGVLQKVAAK